MTVAEYEVERAIKNLGTDKDIMNDYIVMCYKSALGAYKELEKAGHSGMSWNITKHILIDLMNNIPLSPITDEDFKVKIPGQEEIDTPEWLLKKRGLKSQIQCPRMSSLFRSEHLDGVITYTDVDRTICYEKDSDIPFNCGLGSRIVDEMFPITMPYKPEKAKFVVEMETFDDVNKSLTHIISITTPEPRMTPIDRYFFDEGEETGPKEVSMEEYKKIIKNFPKVVDNPYTV